MPQRRVDSDIYRRCEPGGDAFRFRQNTKDDYNDIILFYFIVARSTTFIPTTSLITIIIMIITIILLFIRKVV